MRFEAFPVEAIDCLKISQIGQENGCLDDVFEVERFVFEDDGDIVEDPFGLGLNVIADESPRCRVNRNLACCVEEIPDLNAVIVGAEGFG